MGLLDGWKRFLTFCIFSGGGTVHAWSNPNPKRSGASKQASKGEQREWRYRRSIRITRDSSASSNEQKCLHRVVCFHCMFFGRGFKER